MEWKNTILEKLNQIELPSDPLLLNQLIFELVKELLCDGIWNLGRGIVLLEIRNFIKTQTGYDVSECISQAVEITVGQSKHTSSFNNG